MADHNFYDYCNKDWESHTQIPSYRGAYGVSEEIENEIEDSLESLVKKLPVSHPLSIVWTSALHKEDPSNVKSLQTLFHRLASLESIDSIGRAIGFFNRWQISAPLTLLVNRDVFHSSICRIHFFEPALGIPNYSAYVDHSGILGGYKDMLQTAGSALGFEGLEEVVEIEQLVYKYLSPDGALEDPKQSHNEMSYHQLLRMYPSIPFQSMLEAWGVPKTTIHSTTYIVTNRHFMSAFDRICRTFDLEAMILWLQAYALLTCIKYLPAPYDHASFEFFGKLLQGRTEQTPRDRFAMAVLQTHAPQSLGRVLVSHTPHAKEIKADVVQMVRGLQRAALHRLQTIEWMSLPTRRLASRKLEHMRLRIGYPRRWSEIPSKIELTKTNLLENVLRLNEFDTQQSLKDLGRACAKEDGTWDDGVFLVNAFYYADQNELVIPFGMLHPPFYDRSKSLGWNYGGIGCAIAHEITHGFDDDGRYYDERGNWGDWWSETDKHHYREKTNALVTLFDKRPYKGGFVKGDLTLNENLADLGGIVIALQALLEAIKPIDRVQQLRDFFTAYAVSWRLKDRSKKAKQALQIDRHAPPELRVNLIVQQIPEFYEAFSIPEGSPMWVAPADRIQLW